MKKGMMKIVLLEIMLRNERAGYLNVVNRNITLFITSHCIHFRLSFFVSHSPSEWLSEERWERKNEDGN